MFTKLKRNVLIVIIFAILIYLGLLFFADFDKTISSLKTFPLESFLIALFFIILSMVFKFLRWQIYTTALNLKITLTDSILVFTSGFVMTISPGKIGELLKSFLLKNKYQIPIAKSTPIIAAERIIEFLSLIFISLIGVIIYSSGLIYLLTIISILLAGILLVSSQKIRNILHNLLIKLPFIKNNEKNIEEFNSSLKKLFSIKIILKSLIISIIAWLFEFYGFYLVLSAFTNDINLVLSSFIYSMSIIIGAVSMLPGGIGTTEGAITLLLSQNGLSENIAIASTIIIRFLTLWLSVLIGFVAMIIFLIKKENKSPISSH